MAGVRDSERMRTVKYKLECTDFVTCINSSVAVKSETNFLLRGTMLILLHLSKE
jgi:hypothetical protein